MKALVCIGVGAAVLQDHKKTLRWANAATIGLVNAVTTPMFPKDIRSRKIDPTRLITHHFKLEAILDANDTFSRAAETKALEVIIEV